MAHRIFKDRPHPDFEEAVRAHIRATGQPETFEGLFHGRIPKSEHFILLSKIDIDRKKRPDGDCAPCPMCQPNKFLHGYLCWFHALQVAAVIGHCCADKDVVAAAERRFRYESQRKHQEDYLLQALPLIERKLEALRLLRRPAEEALRLYRRIRNARSVHAALREIDRAGGRLIVHEEVGESVRLASSDTSRLKGPKREFRQVDLGKFDGLTASLTNFNPVKKLEWIERTLASVEPGMTEDEIFEFACLLDDKTRNATYVLLKDADKRFDKLQKRLADFASFFDNENLRKLDAWGGHEANRVPIRVKQKRVLGQRRIEIGVQDDVAALVPDAVLWEHKVSWPTVVTP